MPDEDETERLRRDQAAKADREAQLAEETDDEDEQATHERRAEKAAYLEEKLEAQEAADDAG